MNIYIAVSIAFLIGLFIGCLIIGLCAASGRASLEEELMEAKERLNVFNIKYQKMLNANRNVFPHDIGV